MWKKGYSSGRVYVDYMSYNVWNTTLSLFPKKYLVWKIFKVVIFIGGGGGWGIYEHYSIKKWLCLFWGGWFLPFSAFRIWISSHSSLYTAIYSEYIFNVLKGVFNNE